MKILTLPLCCSVLFVFFSISIFAEEICWVGSAGDDDWFNTANWDPEQVPGYLDDVYFVNPPDGPIDIDFGTGSAQCNNLYVYGTGFNFNLERNGSLEINYDLYLESGNTFNNSGYVEITYNLICYGYFDNYKEAELLVGSKITIYTSGQLDNRGSGNNYSVLEAYELDNFGIFNNEDNSEIHITNRLNNYSQFNSTKHAVTEVGDYFYNTGDVNLDKHSELIVISTLENVGNLVCEDHATIQGDDNLLILNYGDVYVSNHGEVLDVMEVENYQLIVNDNYFVTHDLWQYFKGEIQNTADFHIAYTLENDGEIDNSGSFYIGDVFDNLSRGEVINTGCFEVQANMSNNGSYVGSLLNHASIFGPGTYSYNRNTGGTGAQGDYEGWHYISTPVLGMETHHMFDYWINDWNETQNTWYDLSPGGVPCTTQPPVAFEAMKGYSVKRDINYQCEDFNPGTGEVIEFTGTMNDVASEYMEILVNGSDFEPGDPNSMNNWNLVGNPYPSAIDANLISFPPEIDNAIYYYDDESLSYTTFVGGVGQPFIPVAQGFFLHVNSAGTYTFSLDNSVKTCEGSDDWFKEEISNLLKVEVAGNDNSDHTYIRFKENTSSLFDKEWDAYKLLSGVPSVPQIYSQVNGVDYAINTLNDANKIDLHFETGTSGSYSVSMDGTDDFDCILLEDKIQCKIIDFKEESNYSFYSDITRDHNRFVIHFKEYIPGHFHESVEVFTKEGAVVIKNRDGYTGNIRVCNLLGQTVHSTDLESGLNTLPIDFGSGLYIVQVASGGEKFSRKVYIP